MTTVDGQAPSLGNASRDDVVTWLRSQPDQVEFVRSCYLDVPPAAAGERFVASEEWQAALTLIRGSPGRALDLGAGHGIAAYALARSGWQVTAAEPSPSGITGAAAVVAILRAGAQRGTAARAVGERLPFADGSFDVVYSRQVLHHVSDRRQLCTEVARVLRPGGVYLACGEHVVSNERQRQRFLRSHPTNRYTGDEDALPVGEYRAAFEAGGLEVVRTLRSFDSAINFAPYTRTGLRTALADRMNRIPGGRLLSHLALGERCLPAVLRVLSQVDPRPGRPYSFLARRPA